MPRVGLGMGLGASTAMGGGGAPDIVVPMNASRTYGPGNNASSTTTSAAGSAVPWSVSLVNESGAPMEVADAVFAGRYLTSAGISAVGNDVLTTANITYSSVSTPLTKGGSSTINIVTGAETVTDQVTLPTPIPAGATYTISGVGAPTTGQKYMSQNFGLIMVRSTRLRSTMKPVSLLALGDSIMTNNGGAIFTASLGRCPCVSMSIIGTRISNYVAAYALQLSIAVLAGATHVICNFWVNSANAGDSNATILSQLDTVAAAFDAAGIKWVQTTPTPQSTALTVTPTAAAASGGVLTLSVPDAALFDIGVPYFFSGFTPSTFNGFRTPLTINTGTNVVTFAAGGVADATGTVMGPINAGSTASTHGTSRKFQAPNAKNAQRIEFAEVVRGNHFSGGHIEWAWAVELVPNDGLWPVGGDKPKLLAYRDVAVAGLIGGSDNRASVTGYGYAGSTTAGGFGVWLSGGNANRPITMGNNTGPTDISYTSPATQGGVPVQAGDTLRIIPGPQRGTDDLLHQRVNSGTFGGQQILVDPAAAWIDARLAA